LPAALRRNIGLAKLVALCEASHDGGEPLAFRNRVLLYLVEELWFTAITIESGITKNQVALAIFINQHIRSKIAWIRLLPFGRSACTRENERRAGAVLRPGAVDFCQLRIYRALIAGGELLHFKF
jgi:hypothetical protein